MSAQIMRLTLLPKAVAADFEQTLRTTIWPQVKIFRRNVASTSHRLFRSDDSAGGQPTYVWLVFTKIVGSTPSTAGDGPETLCESPLPMTEIADQLLGLATVETLSEI